jgi:hypothetical protein
MHMVGISKLGTLTSGYDTFLRLSKYDVFYELADLLGGGDAAV